MGLCLFFSTTIWAVHWIIPPTLEYSDEDIQGETRKIEAKCLTDRNRNFQQIEIIKSSGIKALDKKVIEEILKSRLDTEGQSIIMVQPFVSKKANDFVQIFTDKMFLKNEE